MSFAQPERQTSHQTYAFCTCINGVVYVFLLPVVDMNQEYYGSTRVEILQHDTM